MKIENIDDYLNKKTTRIINNLLTYLSPLMALSKEFNNDLSMCDEKRLKEAITCFNYANCDYQDNITAFIIESFHVLEIYMKASLQISGEYLLFRSIDDYPKQKAKWVKDSSDRKKALKELYEKSSIASSKKNDARLNSILEQFVPMLLEENPDISNTVTPREAMNRLINFLNWKVTDDVYRKFILLNDCRNEIIHFAFFENITFGCSFSMQLLLSFSQALPDKFPKFLSCKDIIEENVPSFNEVMQHIKVNEIIRPIVTKIKELT